MGEERLHDRQRALKYHLLGTHSSYNKELAASVDAHTGTA